MMGLNEGWIRFFKPNFTKDKISQVLISNESKKNNWLQRRLESFLEWSRIGEIVNQRSKEMMVRRITQNARTYLTRADIRYGDMALVFLPKPQRDKIMEKAEARLTKMA
jgi:hypothetical protein